ncbi:unnamed protein product [Cyclocybe aegerita]|uniref:Transcription factor TFIIB cyclin-like domain-containing protein n=1 Tax=Cyclocybe aegerita TaxID=1973307 RepID=A0A8S0WD22_CYCAE|nr:unnamed protein product [Cyclocybe aegerita]
MACIHCGAATIWDDSVSSAVCTVCGSLADPTQSVLTSALYAPRDDIETSLWDPAAPTTLKSVRSGNNWDLAGQGKESRDRKNAVAMSEFIKSLAVSLNAPGLSPRAITLFTQMRAATSFRWGNKSRAVAAACLAIALREANRPDSLHDLASILQVPPTSVSRSFTSITTTLGLSLTLVDPTVHIPTLQAHLSSLLAPHQKESTLPVSLINTIRPLSLHSVSSTMTSLSHLLARLSPQHDLLRLPVPPTACAFFLLALEAEARAALNPLGDLAAALGARCHAAKSVVMSRYKTLQDEIAGWVEAVPWLDKYEGKDKGKNGKAKVAKRVVVARGIKDVIKFQEEVWQKHSVKRPRLELDVSEEEGENEHNNEEGSVKPLEVSTEPPRKRQKLNNALSQATRFLLDPLNTPLSTPSPRPSTHSKPAQPSTLSLATYILSTPSLLSSLSSSFSSYPTYMPMPTRLQLLALDRGGSSPSRIPDEDLFAEGELDGLVRSEEEVGLLRRVFGWEEGDGDAECGDEEPGEKKRKRKRKRKGGEPGQDGAVDEGVVKGEQARKRSKRLNLEALHQFFSKDCVDDNTNTGVDATDTDRNDFDLDLDANIQLIGLEEIVGSAEPFLDNNDDDDIEDDDDDNPNEGYPDQRYEEERPP